jgi:tetratricopeptide (TPR) repeat protein
MFVSNGVQGEVMAQNLHYRTIYNSNYSDNRPVLLRLQEALRVALERRDFLYITRILSEENFGPDCVTADADRVKLAALVDQVVVVARACGRSQDRTNCQALAGRFYANQGRFTEAEQNYREAISASRFDRNRSDVLKRCRIALGILTLKKDDLNGAERLYRDVRWPNNRMSATEMEQVFRTQNSTEAIRTGEAVFAGQLAAAYQAKGNNREALKKYDDMLAYQTFILDHGYVSRYASVIPCQKTTVTVTYHHSEMTPESLFFDPLVGRYPSTERLIAPFLSFASEHPSLVSSERLQKIRNQVQDLVALRFAQENSDKNWDIQVREQALFGHLRHDPRRALAELKSEVEQRRKEDENDPLLADSLNSIGYHLMLVGYTTDAEHFLREAITARERQGALARFALGNCLSNLAALFIDQGKVVDAKPLVLRALRLRDGDPVDPYAQAKTQIVYGRLLMTQGNYAEAEKNLRLAIESLSIREGHRKIVDLRDMGISGRRRTLQDSNHNAASIIIQTQAEIYCVQAKIELANCLLHQRQLVKARDLIESESGRVSASPDAFSVMGSSYGGLYLQARILQVLGRIDMAAGNYKASENFLERARQEVAGGEATAMAAVDVYESLGDLRAGTSAQMEARKNYHEAARRLEKMVPSGNTRLAKLRRLAQS